MNDNVFFLNLNSAFSFAPESKANIENSVNNENLPTILSIKIPAKVNSIENVIDLLGGIDNIDMKNKKDDDIHFKLLSIDLEKCYSYDYLLKKKRKRSKK
jgi:hypothetical protein